LAVSFPWRLEDYRGLLHLQARQLQLDPRLQLRADWSDLVQETFLKAHENRAQFDGRTEAEMVGWLQGILRNVVVDEVRKAHAQKRDVAVEQSIRAAVDDSSMHLNKYLADQQASPSQQAEWREFLVRFDRALEELPEDQRNVVVQRDVMGAPVAAIAQQLRTTEKAVAGLLLRGRRRLRALLAVYE
jgi:RNA polymerase sigma-70 factor (ECF subfamily)